MEINKIYNVDCLEGLKTLHDESINCCVASPPYFNLRDYGCDGQIGLEDTPEEYITKLVAVFREVKRVLRNEFQFYFSSINRERKIFYPPFQTMKYRWYSIYYPLFSILTSPSL